MIEPVLVGIGTMDSVSLGFGYSVSFIKLKKNPNIGTEYTLGDGRAWIRRVDRQPLSIGTVDNDGGLIVPDSGLRVRVKPGTFVAELLLSVQARRVNFRLCLSEDIYDLADSPHANYAYEERVKFLQLSMRTGNAAYLHILGGANEVLLHSINLANLD